MNGLRRFAAIFLATVLAVLAPPAGAANPEKIYSINVSPLGATPIAVTIKNETPNGNSTINSFVITAPAGVTITSLGNPAASASANVQLTGGKVYVNSFTGLQAGNKTPKSLTVYVNATYPNSAACGAAYTWTAAVYTGNSFGQETFGLVAGVPPTNPTQTANCEYKVTMSPGSLAAGIASSLTATIYNKTAAGGPALTTATLAAPAGITPKPGGLAASSGTASLAGATVTVSGASVAPGGSMTVTIPVDTACAASTGNWSTTASGGSGSFSPSTSDPSSLGTAVTGACSMSFQQQPTSVVAGVAMSPPVIAVVNGATGNPVPWFSGSVWLTTGSCSAGIAGAVPGGTATAVGGVATFGSVVLTTPGTTTLTACSLLGSTTLSLSSSAFTVWGGTLGCTAASNKGGNLDPGLDVAYVNVPPDWGLIRGNNKDGAACVVVPYTFTLDTASVPQKASFVVPPGTGQAVSAQYIVVWKPIAVLPSTDPNAYWTITRPKLAWKTDGSGNPVYIPALSCVVDPDNFTLVTTTSVPSLDDLLPTIPNVAPFNLPANAAHYPVNSKAKMCVSQVGWTSVGKDGSGNTLVQYWTKVIDQGDGFMSLD